MRDFDRGLENPDITMCHINSNVQLLVTFGELLGFIIELAKYAGGLPNEERDVDRGSQEMVIQLNRVVEVRVVIRESNTDASS